MFLDSLISLIAPYECLGCNAEGALLCSTCRTRLPPAIPRCFKCQQDKSSFATCFACRTSSSLCSATAAVAYKDTAKDLVWKLKFGRSQAAAAEMAAVIDERLHLRSKLSGHQAADIVITHAPTAASRVRQRGYDQAALIARALAKGCGLPYSPLLRRRGNQEQIGASRGERASQLEHAFYAVRVGRVRGAHIILIDDVITTGATLEAAAKVLVEAGARRVDAIVFAQA